MTVEQKNAKAMNTNTVNNGHLAHLKPTFLFKSARMKNLYRVHINKEQLWN